MNSMLMLIGCAALVVGAAAADGDIVTTKVVGEEFQGAYKHPASFTELDNGDLYLAYYGGGGEYEDDSCVWGMRLKKGEDTWTTPQVIADTPFRSEGNPVVWQAPDGIVWLFYVQSYGETWSASRIKAKISKDQGHTWSDSFMVAWEQGMMARGRPIVLNDGGYLLPIYHERGHDREMTTPDTTSLFLRYSPKTHEWTETNRIASRMGNEQPAVVQITDDYLVAYCRRSGSYDPIPDGWMVRTESHDGGRTWSQGEETKFQNPNSAVEFIKLRNGHLMLIYNDSMCERTPLTVAVSLDNDKTYPYRRNIGEGDNTFAYPVAFQAKDGKIHVIYTTNERTQINHVVFDESAILKPEYKVE